MLQGLGAMSLKDAVSEIYPPPRVKALAHRLGLRKGFALDLTVIDPEDGMPWDFGRPEKRQKAYRMVQEEKPMLLIGSPMCTAFSNLQKFNRRKNPAMHQRMLDYAVMHISFCISLYRLQMAEGRYFLHEHPWWATSWKLPQMVKLMDEFGVFTVRGDMCRFGMTSKDHEGSSPVKKPTGWMTNSLHI